MPPRIVVVRHALRNALLPAIQGSGLVMGWLLGSVVIVETVFQYPGLGSALTSAIQDRDLPVIQAIVLMFAVGIVVFNLIADVLTIYLTPKLRTSADVVTATTAYDVGTTERTRRRGPGWFSACATRSAMAGRGRGS